MNFFFLDERPKDEKVSKDQSVQRHPKDIKEFTTKSALEAKDDNSVTVTKLTDTLSTDGKSGEGVPLYSVILSHTLIHCHIILLLDTQSSSSQSSFFIHIHQLTLVLKTSFFGQKPHTLRISAMWVD